MAQPTAVERVLEQLQDHEELLLQFWQAIEDAAEFAEVDQFTDTDRAAVLGQLCVYILESKPNWVLRTPGL